MGASIGVNVGGGQASGPLCQSDQVLPHGLKQGIGDRAFNEETRLRVRAEPASCEIRTADDTHERRADPEEIRLRMEDGIDTEDTDESIEPTEDVGVRLVEVKAHYERTEAI